MKDSEGRPERSHFVIKDNLGASLDILRPLVYGPKQALFDLINSNVERIRFLYFKFIFINYLLEI